MRPPDADGPGEHHIAGTVFAEHSREPIERRVQLAADATGRRTAEVRQVVRKLGLPS